MNIKKNYIKFNKLNITEKEYYNRASYLTDIFNAGFSKFYNVEAEVNQLDFPPYCEIKLKEKTLHYNFIPHISRDFSFWLFDLPNKGCIKNNGIIFNIHTKSFYHVDYEYTKHQMKYLNKNNSYPKIKYIKYLNKKEIVLTFLTFLTSVGSGITIEYFLKIDLKTILYKLLEVLDLYNNSVP